MIRFAYLGLKKFSLQTVESNPVFIKSWMSHPVTFMTPNILNIASEEFQRINIHLISYFLCWADNFIKLNFGVIISTSWDLRPPDKETPNNFLSSSHYLKFNKMKQKVSLIVDFIDSQVKAKEIFYRSIYFIKRFCGHISIYNIIYETLFFICQFE